MDFGLCYNPEFIALGSVVRDMLNPDMILIGESDARSGAILEELYTGRVRKQSADSADELRERRTDQAFGEHVRHHQDLATPTCWRRSAKRCRARTADVVTSALGCDTRIGPKYLKGALGYGGPCFPRDNVAFSALARENGVPALLAEATDDLNRRQVPRLAELLLSHLPAGGTVGVLGLSYKPHTEVIEESQGVAIAKELAARGARVVVYDPAAMESTRRVLGDRIEYAATAAECARTGRCAGDHHSVAGVQESLARGFEAGREAGDRRLLAGAAARGFRGRVGVYDAGLRNVRTRAGHCGRRLTSRDAW